MAEKSSQEESPLYYHFEDKLSWWQYALYGFEQMLIMDSVFALPVLLGLAFHLSSSNLIYLIQAVLIGSGITTILQSAALLKLPVAQGIGASITGVGITLAALGITFASFITAAIISVIIMGLFLIPFIPSRSGTKSIMEYLLVLVKDPQVYGVLITIIGVVLLGSVVGLINKGNYTFLSDVGSAITLGAILILIFAFKKGILRFGSIIIGLLIGAVFAIAAGMMKLSLVFSYPLFAVPVPFFIKYGTAITASGVEIAMIGVLLATIMLVTEAVGVYYTVGDLDKVKVDDKRVRKGLTGEMIGSLIGLLIGGMSTTTYAQNVGSLQVTRVGSRHVFTATGIILIIMGFIPKIGAFIVSIPPAILGSAYLVIYSMLLVQGFKIIGSMKWTDKNMMIVAVSLAVGIILPSVSSVAFITLPSWFRSAVISQIVLATVVAIILNLIVNLIPKWINERRQPGISQNAEVKSGSNIIQNMEPDQKLISDKKPLDNK